MRRIPSIEAGARARTGHEHPGSLRAPRHSLARASGVATSPAARVPRQRLSAAGSWGGGARRATGGGGKGRPGGVRSDGTTGPAAKLLGGEELAKARPADVRAERALRPGWAAAGDGMAGRASTASRPDTGGCAKGTEPRSVQGGPRWKAARANPASARGERTHNACVMRRAAVAALSLAKGGHDGARPHALAQGGRGLVFGHIEALDIIIAALAAGGPIERAERASPPGARRRGPEHAARRVSGRRRLGGGKGAARGRSGCPGRRATGLAAGAGGVGGKGERRTANL